MNSEGPKHGPCVIPYFVGHLLKEVLHKYNSTALTVLGMR